MITTATLQLFERTPNAIVYRNLSGQILSVNRAFQEIFGYRPGESIGSDLAYLLRPPGEKDQNPREWTAEEAITHFPTKRRRSDGSLVNVSVSLVPVTVGVDTEGTFVIYSGVSTRSPSTEPTVSEMTYRSIFNNAVEGIFLTTPQGRYLDVNPALAAIYGFSSPAELIGHFRDIKQQLYVDPQRRDEFIRILRQDGKVTGFESQVRRKNGEVIWITENARTVFAQDGKIAYYEGTVMEITDRKRAERELAVQRANFSQLFANSPQAIIIIDTHRNVVDCNPGFEELFGFRAADIIGFGVRDLIVPDELLVECENVRKSILSGKTVQNETSRRCKDGRMIPVSMIGFPIRVDDRINGIIYIYQDISERKTFEAQISHQAFHDALTGLPNRALFTERLDRALERSRRRTEFRYALLLIDLNKFKAINDSLGHPAGDQLLVEIGRRLFSCTRAMDTVARLGGDEFAIILEEFTNEDELLRLVDRIHRTLRQPFTIGTHTLPCGGSIGVVPDIVTYSSAEDILRDADIAMYRAKQHGKGIILFDKAMHQELIESISLERELREAVANQELQLFYQPIMDLADESLEGFEALLRWHNPLRGMVPPDRFIRLAEETGMIVDLGKWVIDEACRTLGAWQRLSPATADLTMSVNVSVRQFTRPGLVEHIGEALRKNELHPSSFKIEVTESILMQDTEQVVAQLNRLKSIGVKIAIDDFGTGYSSLSYLRNLPIDHLKIDRSFISGGALAAENDRIVQSIIALGRSLGLSVIAEGVETRDQLEKLRELMCNKAQGFMFSRPVDQEKALSLIARYRH